MTIVFWFIAFAYFTKSDDFLQSTSISQMENLDKPIETKGINKINIKINPSMSNTSEPMSFNLVSNGIQIPSKLPALPNTMLEMK